MTDDAWWNELSGGIEFEREILVALQPEAPKLVSDGTGCDWDGLTAAIESASPTWRWWIRRHPMDHHSLAGRDAAEIQRAHARITAGDRYYPRLVAASDVRSSRRVVPLEEVTRVGSLGAMLHRVDVFVTMTSASSQAAYTQGVPVLFLDPRARFRCVQIFDEGRAKVIESGELNAQIAQLPRRGSVNWRPPAIWSPDTLARLASPEHQRLRRGRARRNPEI